MAELNPPFVLQGANNLPEHPADVFRRAIQALTLATEGVIAEGALKVSQAGTPGMRVAVAPGEGVVIGDNRAYQGSYVVANDAAKEVTIDASSQTLPRKDAIVFEVRDNEEAGGGNNDSLIHAVTGMEAASPAIPATPSNSILLAVVDVAANATQILNGNVSDKRTRVSAVGGLMVCTQTPNTKPTNPYTGQRIMVIDTMRDEVWNGSAWIRMEQWSYLGRTGCELGRDTDAAVFDNTPTELVWLLEDTDTDGFHSANSATVTIPSGCGGLYAIVVIVSATATLNGGSGAWIEIQKSNGRTWRFDGGHGGGQAMTASLGAVKMNEGQSITVWVYQNSGAPKTITDARLEMWKVGN